MKSSRSTHLLLPAISLLVVGLGCQTVMSAINPPTATPIPTSTPIPTEEAQPIDGEPVIGEAFDVSDEGAFHIEFGETATYEHYPPSSGLHYGQILDWGFYEDPVPPEYWVHSLEHGGIVILYQCPSDCTEVQDAIWSVLDNAPLDDIFNSKKILTSPNSDIESPVVALAWTVQMNLESVDEEALHDFYLRHVNEGPELIP